VPRKKDDNVERRGLMGLVGWGCGAAIALLIAALSVRSDGGSQRLTEVLPPVTQTARAALGNKPPAGPRDAETDMRWLSATVRSLWADRDRLLARVAVLERTMEDVTGSIERDNTRSSSPAPAAAPPAPAPAAAAAPAVVSPPKPSPGPSVTATIAAAPPGRPGPLLDWSRLDDSQVAAFGAPDSAPAQGDFGIDLGGGANFGAMHGLWSSARSKHANLLDGLRPLISIRESTKPGKLELRLVAGPVANAAAAARLCASLAANGWACRPAVFDGQKLLQ
jgi:hypothetical protein